MNRIAIVGGGFSGAITAVNLARFSESPLRVTLVNRHFPTGRGVAYGTRRIEHLLNVAARNMSALADHPQHFVDWLRTRSEYADAPEATLREMFAPRRLYGDYLQGLLFSHTRPVNNRFGFEMEIVEDEAIDVVDRAPGVAVELAGGAVIEADKALLATGNQQPAEIPSAGEPFRHPHYCQSPWDDWEDRVPRHRENVILLGTGLTSIDAFLTLSALGFQGTTYAVSRNGFLPESHFRGIEYADFPPSDPESLGLSGLAAMIDAHCTRLREMGANPAIVVDKLRPHTQRIWQKFTLDEKRQFCRRMAARWNATRHRVAQEIYRQVTSALADGRLQIVKGKIGSLQAAGSLVRVPVEGPSGTSLTLEGRLVINCTGPNPSFAASGIPLFQNLLAKGMVAVDDLDMGIRVSADFAVVDSAGQASKNLYAIGPLLKGSLWETTAVPELRGQALRVAQALIDSLATDARKPGHWPAPAQEELLEYCI